MPRAYSMDLRKRVIEACNQGETIVQVAKRFAVSPPYVNQLQQRLREGGTLDPKPLGGGLQLRLSSDHDETHDETLRALLATKPDTTLAELRDKLGDKSSSLQPLVSPPAPRPDLQKNTGPKGQR